MKRDIELSQMVYSFNHFNDNYFLRGQMKAMPTTSSPSLSFILSPFLILLERYSLPVRNIFSFTQCLFILLTIVDPNWWKEHGVWKREREKCESEVVGKEGKGGRSGKDVSIEWSVFVTFQFSIKSNLYKVDLDHTHREREREKRVKKGYHTVWKRKKVLFNMSTHAWYFAKWNFPFNRQIRLLWESAFHSQFLFFFTSPSIFSFFLFSLFSALPMKYYMKLVLYVIKRTRDSGLKRNEIREKLMYYTQTVWWVIFSSENMLGDT